MRPYGAWGKVKVVTGFMSEKIGRTIGRTRDAGEYHE
jgi:hypothetical protein